MSAPFYGPTLEQLLGLTGAQSGTPPDSGGVLAQVGNAIGTGVSDIASLLRGLTQGGNQYVTSGGLALPGGGGSVNASALTQLLKVLGGAVAVGGAGELGAAGVSSLLGAGGGGAMRAPRQIIQTYNDKNGNLRVRYYVSKGQPVLFSGDIASVRRVQRVAKRVRGQSVRRRSYTRVMCAGCGMPERACGCSRSST